MIQMHFTLPFRSTLANHSWIKSNDVVKKYPSWLSGISIISGGHNCAIVMSSADSIRYLFSCCIQIVDHVVNFATVQLNLKGFLCVVLVQEECNT